MRVYHPVQKFPIDGAYEAPVKTDDKDLPF